MSLVIYMQARRWRGEGVVWRRGEEEASRDERVCKGGLGCEREQVEGRKS